MKIRIIGGGPAGLYFAALMKREDASHDIVVHEATLIEFGRVLRMIVTTGIRLDNRRAVVPGPVCWIVRNGDDVGLRHQTVGHRKEHEQEPHGGRGASAIGSKFRQEGQVVSR